MHVPINLNRVAPSELVLRAMPAFVVQVQMQGNNETMGVVLCWPGSTDKMDFRWLPWYCLTCNDHECEHVWSVLRGHVHPPGSIEMGEGKLTILDTSGE